MKTIYPGATYKPLRSKRQRRFTASPKRVNLHTAVSEAPSLHGYFDRSTSPDSHIYLLRDGSMEQYVPFNCRANADLEGNSSTISIETQGGVKNADREKWTEAQVEALARLIAWLHKELGIRLVMAKDSIPGKSSEGVSWHRLGIDGNFPSAYPMHGRKPGGLKYSNHRGKLCPGAAKIQQIPGIVARAKDIVASEKPKKKPKKKVANPALQVDGWWGPATTRALQRYLGTPVDGVLSGQRKRARNAALKSAEWTTSGSGSMAIREIQKRLKLKARHGRVSAGTIRALQRALGTPVDGVISSPSLMVKALQRGLNAGKLPF